MAKINAHGARQVGPTLFTERTITWLGEGDALYYEAWRLRSDNMVQTRIIKVTQPDGRVTEHRGSAFRNVGKIGRVGSDPDIQKLRTWLTGRDVTIVKEKY